MQFTVSNNSHIPFSGGEEQSVIIMFTEWDRCIQCDDKQAKDVCQNCGDVICLSSKCALTFPHKNNSQFSVCKRCEKKISNKFKMVEIELYPELRLLKKKIKRRIEKRIEENV
jgi:predicted amidophosphoribosyltransferase|uniref:Uncharacterized protein n=1 Tax=viral metagenome TaxID=1070528 RepID=A0A6C0CJH1_9ZZZZ